MRKAKLYQLLAVAGGLSAAVATTPVLAADSVTLAAGGGSNSFTIEFLSKSGNTWSYKVSETGRELSHWSLGIANCKGAVTGGTGGQGFETGSGGNADQLLKDTGVDWMVKWDTDGGVGDGEVFTLTLDGDYEAADVGVLVKTGGSVKQAVGTITAPDCSTPVAEDPPAEEPPVEEPPAEEPPVEEPPVEEPPAEEPPAEEPPVEEPPAEEPPVEEPPAEEPPAEEPPAEEPPVEEPTSGGGNPNMACSEIMGSNGAPMSLIAKYETDDDGNYNFAQEGTDIINIEGNIEDALSGGTFSVDGDIVKVAAVIVKGGTVALPDEDGNDSFSNAGLVNNGNQIADISNVQFCQEGVFDSAGAEVCLWSANKDADGNYINIEQVGCVDAEKGKFYAIEAAGEFSNALEAE